MGLADDYQLALKLLRENSNPTLRLAATVIESYVEKLTAKQIQDMVNLSDMATERVKAFSWAIINDLEAHQVDDDVILSALDAGNQAAVKKLEEQRRDYKSPEM